jgi:hypothetical protein
VTRWRWPWGGLLLALAVGAAVRAPGLGAKSLWFNEAVSASALDFSAGELLARCAEPESPHPPLHFLALKAWAAALGGSDLALRSLSVASGLTVIVLTYLTVRELAAAVRRGPDPAAAPGPAAPALAATLVALSPLQIHLSQQVRGYSLAEALLVGGQWALARALLGRGGKAAWVASAVLAVGACYTHHLAVLSVVAGGVVVAVVLARDPGADRRGAATAAVLFAAGYLGPWLPRVFAQSEVIRHDAPRRGDFPVEILRALYATADGGGRPDAALAWVAAAVVFGGLGRLALRRGPAGGFVAALGVAPVLMMGGYSAVSNRSLLQVRSLGFAQLSWLMGLALLVGGVRPRLERSALALGVVAWSLAGCCAGWRVIGPNAAPGVRAAVRFLLDHRDPSEPVIVRSPFTYYGVAHYARGRARPRLYAPRADRHAVRGSEHLRDRDLITPGAAAGVRSPGVWVVSSRSYLGPDDQAALPAGWSRRGLWVFAQDYQSETPVSVEHFATGTAAPARWGTDRPAVMRPRGVIPPGGRRPAGGSGSGKLSRAARPTRR